MISFNVELDPNTSKPVFKLMQCDGSVETVIYEHGNEETGQTLTGSVIYTPAIKELKKLYGEEVPEAPAAETFKARRESFTIKERPNAPMSSELETLAYQNRLRKQMWSLSNSAF